MEWIICENRLCLEYPVGLALKQFIILDLPSITPEYGVMSSSIRTNNWISLNY